MTMFLFFVPFQTLKWKKLHSREIICLRETALGPHGSESIHSHESRSAIRSIVTSPALLVP